MARSLKADFDADPFNNDVVALRDRIIQESIEGEIVQKDRGLLHDARIEGYTICKNLISIADFEAVIGLRRGYEADRRREQERLKQPSSNEYWKFRCATLKIEFVYECMKIARESAGRDGTQSLVAQYYVANLMKRLPEPK